jgi:cysteine desulfurase family protein
VPAPTPSRPVAYLDHGATSWPKPQQVVDAVVHALTDLGGNPGRGAYAMALAASRAIFEARRTCAELLGVADSRNLLFQPSCTAGCNLMLKGTLKPGDRVVVGSMEHNAVARPLEQLARAGVEVVVVQADAAGLVDPDDVEREVRAEPTRAVVCQHASNLTGTLQLIGDLADIAHEHGALMFVDGAQGAGHVEVDISVLGVDGYATSGHKGMLGPQGVGLLYLSPDLDVHTQVEGGTGGGGSESPDMPPERPDRYEPGTGNTPGIVGLGAAAAFLAAEGSRQRRREADLVRRIHEGILEIDGFRVLGPPPGVPRVPIVSAVHDRVEADRIAFALDRSYGIAARAGLHCAPWAHRTIGTIDCGAVRFGVGWGNTYEHVELALRALREIVSS